MFKVWIFFKSKHLFLAIMLMGFISACSTQANTTATQIEFQQLRITNSSNVDISKLVILFPGYTPDSEASRVKFGDVPAGETTKYLDVPSGVYRYAAYEYTLNGQVVTQFVTDWVGENPMVGKKFTYQILLDLQKVEGDQIILVEALVDEP